MPAQTSTSLVFYFNVDKVYGNHARNCLLGDLDESNVRGIVDLDESIQHRNSQTLRRLLPVEKTNTLAIIATSISAVHHLHRPFSLRVLLVQEMLDPHNLIVINIPPTIACGDLWRQTTTAPPQQPLGARASNTLIVFAQPKRPTSLRQPTLTQTLISGEESVGHLPRTPKHIVVECIDLEVPILPQSKKGQGGIVFGTSQD